MSLIPKVIYQTWKTKELDENIKRIRNNIQNLNPYYKMVLFDDEDMNTWIKDTFRDNDEIIYNTYKLLKIGAAKADFWRYLILYMNGGIYLDIDSNINKPLDLLINNDDQAIVSREKKSGNNYFIQWCLFFSPKHPILLKCINTCISNINNKITTWLPNLTGPAVFTNSVNYILKKKYCKNIKINLFHFSDDWLNTNFNDNNCKCRFFGSDYNDYCSYTHEFKHILLNSSIYWKDDPDIFNE